jgi:hypothetical protein
MRGALPASTPLVMTLHHLRMVAGNWGFLKERRLLAREVPCTSPKYACASADGAAQRRMDWADIVVRLEREHQSMLSEAR